MVQRMTNQINLKYVFRNYFVVTGKNKGIPGLKHHPMKAYSFISINSSHWH